MSSVVYELGPAPDPDAIRNENVMQLLIVGGVFLVRPTQRTEQQKVALRNSTESMAVWNSATQTRPYTVISA